MSQLKNENVHHSRRLLFFAAAITTLLFSSNLAASVNLPASNTLQSQILASLQQPNPGRLSQFSAPVSDFVREALLLGQNTIQSPGNGVGSFTPTNDRPSRGGGGGTLHALPQEIFTLDTSGLPQNEQAIGVNGSNVIVASNDYRPYLTFLSNCFFHGNCKGIFIGTGIDVSHDGGNTISRDLLGPVSPNLMGAIEGDAGVAITKSAIYVSSLNFSIFLPDNGIVLWKSTDGGNTFTPTTSPVLFRGTKAFSVFVDKDAIAVDNTLKGKTVGNLYVTWTNFSFAGSNIAVAVSGDGGSSWTTHAVTNVTNFYQFSYPAVGPDGTVYIVYADYHQAASNFFACFISPPSPSCNPGYGPIFLDMVKSTNGGKTWTSPTIVQRIDKPFTWPFFTELANNFFRVATQPKIAVDGTGIVYVGWDDLSAGRQVQAGKCFQDLFISGIIEICSPGSKGAAVFVVHSTNSGGTWSGPVMASPALTNGTLFDSYMPWLSVDSSNGHLAVAYYTSQPDAVFNHQISIGVAISANGGASFTQSVLPQFYEPSVDGFFAGFFWGDYLGAAAAGGFVAIAYTGDLRQTFGWFEQDPYLTVVSD